MFISQLRCYSVNSIHRLSFNLLFLLKFFCPKFGEDVQQGKLPDNRNSYAAPKLHQNKGNKRHCVGPREWTVQMVRVRETSLFGDIEVRHGT